MKNTPIALFGLFIFCLLQVACVNLKEVHAFTESSVQTLANDHQIDYKYTDYCWDSCYVFNTTGKQLVEFDCNCRQDEKYDSIVRKEYDVLSDYFTALGKLAGAESYFNFAPISSAIQEGTYGNLTVTANEAKVVNALATVATDLFTTKYKSKKIKEVLEKYHDTVTLAMEIMQLHIDNLKSMIGLMRTKLQLRGDMLMNGTPTDGEKWGIVYTYKQKYKELGRIIATYDKRYQSLEKIKQGHITLYENVNDLHSDGLKKKILGFAYDIIYINNH